MPTPQITTFDQLRNYINANLADNNSAAIDPVDVRTALSSFVDIQSLKNDLLAANLSPENAVAWNALIKKLEEIQVGNNLGFLTPTSLAAPVTGIHRGQASVEGTYTNFKDAGSFAIVVSAGDLLGNFVFIEVTNGVAKKVVVPFQTVTSASTLATMVNGTTYVAGSTFTSSNAIYTVKSGQSFIAGTDSLTNESKLSFVLQGVNEPKIIKKSVLDASGVMYVSGDVDSNGDVYSVGYIANFIGIYKNNVLLKSLAVSTYNLGASGVAIKKLNNSIYILISSNLATASDNGLFSLRYDIATETFNTLAKLSTGFNEKLTCISIVNKGGDLYCAVNVDGISNGTSWDLAHANKRIDLFKLLSDVWVKQNTIHAYNQEWDARFQKVNFFYDDALDNIAIAPINGTLFVNEKGNLGAYFTSNSNDYLNRVFSKELIGNNWIIEYLTNNKAAITYAWIDKFGQRKLYQKKYYDVAMSFTLSRSIITNTKCAPILDIVGGDSELGVAVNNNGKTVYFRRNYVSARSYVETFEMTDEYINSFVNIQPINYIGDVTPTTTPPINLKKGDYFIAKQVGTYLFSDYFELFGSITRNYISVRLGETIQIIWNGFTWVKKVASDLGISAIKNTPLLGNAINNEFGSKSFRIPVITETVKGTLVIGVDARRTSGSDYSEIDGVICRSGDGGKTWTDYKTIFKRNMSIEGARVHDLGLTVDRNINSLQYGRIWAFAKEWLANIDPNVNMQYFVDNPDKMTFWVSYSDDDGLTWSAKAERKDLMKSGSFQLSSGVCAGLTLSDGTLIQPIYNVYSVTDARSGFLKKSVGGDWVQGDEIPSSFGNTNENSIIQDIDGKLLMNARTTGLTRKVFELSSIGNGWVNKPNLEVWNDVVGGCQNSFIRYRNTYLYAQPTPNGTATRNNIKVWYSYDKINWQVLVQLTDGTASGGYTSIVATDNNFNVVFESTLSGQGSISHIGLNYLRNILK